MGACITAIEYFLPDTIIGNDILEKEFPDMKADKIEQKVGIRERHVAKPNETALDLAVACSNKLLGYIDKDAIDFLIFCTQSPDYFLPTTACILQERLCLKTTTGAFDINLGCSGYIYGLAVSKGLIAAGIAENVLLVTAETYSKHIHPGDRGNRTIFGDGSAATLVSASKSEKIFEFVLGTNGKGHANLIVPNGGMRHRYQEHAPEETDKNGCIRTDNHLFMNGPEIFNFTIGAIPQLVGDILKKNSMSLEGVDYVIFHQANTYILDYLRKKIKIPPDKFYMDMTATGNTVSATIPIAIKDALEKGLIKPGDKVLLAGFGVGYSWGAVLIEI